MPALRLSDRVAQQLLELIQKDQLQHGERLPTERALSEQMGVSRTALREAIQKLSSQGILESRVGAGTFVRTPVQPWHEQAISPLEPLIRDDPQYRYDVLEARQMIELTTAWHAAQRATDKDRDHIRRCFDEMLHHQQRLDFANSARADAQFHLAIAEASHNVVLLQTMRGFFDLLQSSVKQSRQRMYLVPPVFARLTEQHQAVMEAIFAGDAEGARQAMMAHLGFVHATIKHFDEDQARQARITRLPGDHNENARENP